jgi:hypothetical protein
VRHGLIDVEEAVSVAREPDAVRRAAAMAED